MRQRLVLLCACLSAAGVACSSVAAPKALAPAPLVAIQRDVNHWGPMEHSLLSVREAAPAGEWRLSQSEHRLAAVSRGMDRDPEVILKNLAEMDAKRVAELSLLIPSYVRPEMLDRVLEGTGLAGLGSVFVAAESEWGLNAVALVAIAAHESNWGRSVLARERRNLFGFAAYTENPGKARVFATRREAVLTAARFIRENYLAPEGKYHKGTSLNAIGPTWAEDPRWAHKVARAWQYIAERMIQANAAEPISAAG